jgi:hypothetical protein
VDSKSLPPHPATIPRVRAVQPKLPSSLPALAPHPAKLPRVRAVQPKLANTLPPHPAKGAPAGAAQPKSASALPPHPATLPPTRAAQPKLAQPDRAPHAAKLAGQNSVQRAARGAVVSAAEAGRLLGADRAGFVATVSRDESGEVGPGNVRLIFDVKE